MHQVRLVGSVSPDEVATALRRRLGSGHRVDVDGDGRLLVRGRWLQSCRLSINPGSHGTTVEIRAASPPVPAPLLAAILRWSSDRGLSSAVGHALAQPGEVSRTPVGRAPQP